MHIYYVLCYVFSMLNFTCMFIIMSISVMRHDLWCTVRDMRLSKCSITIIILCHQHLLNAKFIFLVATSCNGAGYGNCLVTFTVTSSLATSCSACNIYNNLSESFVKRYVGVACVSV